MKRVPSLETAGYRSKLRSAAFRPALAEASNNSRSPKRKPTEAPAESRTKKRRPRIMNLRGRSLKSMGADKELDDLSEDHRDDGSSVEHHGSKHPLDSTSILAPSQRSSNTGTSSRTKSSKSKSPSKRGVKDVGQAVSNAAVDIPFLSQCIPNLRPASYADLTAAKKVPEKVKSLYWKLQIPSAVIPRELKVRYCCTLSSPSAAFANLPLGILRCRGKHPTEERCPPQRSIRQH